MDNSPRDSEILAEILGERARRDAEAEGADLDPATAPEPEELLDLLEDRLPPQEARRLERRVLADPEAAQALLDLAELAEAEASAGAGRPPEVATHAGWRDFQSRLEEKERKPRRTPPWLMAVAAALLVAAVGLSAWVWTFRDDPAPTLVANLPTLELAADVRGEETVVPLAPREPLRLVLAPAERCPTYRASVQWTGPAGATWTRPVEGLVRDRLGRVTLLLSGEPGAYTLALSGCDPPRELESHRFRIVPESDGG